MSEDKAEEDLEPSPRACVLLRLPSDSLAFVESLHGITKTLSLLFEAQTPTKLLAGVEFCSGPLSTFVSSSDVY